MHSKRKIYQDFMIYQFHIVGACYTPQNESYFIYVHVMINLDYINLNVVYEDKCLNNISK